MTSTYSAAGVDIDAGDLAVQLMKEHLKKARRPEVVGDIGGFAGLFDVSALKKFNRPLLATSTDGVGTKTEIARQLGKYDTIGEDLVAMVVDDLVVCGAEPLFMTDYIAVGKVFPERIAEIVSGIARGCAKAGTALVGGETAEHPGLLAEDEFDIAGAATGAVDYENLLGAEKVKAGDVIIAMPASGIHANGFSLVRHILKTKNLNLNNTPQNFAKTLGEVLLTPTEIYSLDCLALINGLKKDLHAFTHITGGGIADNTARVIPAGLKAVYDRSTWALPLEMLYLAQIGGVPEDDMERTWNCGIGMAAILAPESADLAIRSLAARGMKAWVAGVIKTELTGNSAGTGSAALEATYQPR
ncbi:MAG: phosphoribosylformylglycinamidine cyclo-ligase [Actinobacteria bacterium]|uniref:phosphoribosylformylglycinamidine cyclo-ligase n=1 Tax=freshwater metagenome TaxID=449393 RepID=A0A6J6QJ35_9ZZZZ|nr:phosphoribosylformylglycinamidine cyclo-ligase [Actinomycetota bacterium]MSW22697.1 phosphoribosylformylglycinamidine cyclo-ligase [Actinomycetota bacterium]MSX04431.1 phosphoribosylformylglycinamidine cyclo-ligase [Actinomycetota bacterium]MSX61003.1 phosphoribosylformylglycinamidine cyclo-ligase [Actinomycetota bacterium]MSX84494.1 phosphoribosylformylglycinamidine cyclo-ligase [Actinomycetota bacterium]